MFANSGSSLSQDLAMDRILSSPVCIHTDHRGNFIFFCRMEVENLLKLPVNFQTPFLSNRHLIYSEIAA